MGELVLFRPVGGQERRNRAERGSNAQILLFTGVRYQRADDALAPAQAIDAGASPKGGLGGAGGGRRKRRG